MAPPIFMGASREVDWFEKANRSRSLSTKEDKVFEWIVWTLVTLSLLLAILGGTFVVHGVLQFDFPLMR